jgi:hypothetical protein
LSAERADSQSKYKNLRHLGHAALLAERRVAAELIKALRSRLQSTRKKLRAYTVKALASDAADSGNMKAVAQRLLTIVNEINTSEGSFESSQRIVFDVIKNFTRLTRGSKFSQTTRDFYTVLNVWGGPRLVKFVSNNLEGPGLTTVQTWGTNERKLLMSGCQEDNFRLLGEIYTDIAADISGFRKGPVFCAEDETIIPKCVSWDAPTDHEVGWCGQACAKRCKYVKNCKCDNRHQ